MKNNFDIIAIGDMVTDAFIRLKDASVNCDINHEKCMISMRFGDKVPYESVEVIRAVGNAANAAVSASRLGLSSALVANIGDDLNGKECLEKLNSDGVVTYMIKTHKHMETNYHYVLWYEDDRTILVKHQEYNYSLPDIGNPKWVYLSSLAQNTLPYHKEIIEYLKKNPDIKLAFQPGTFQMQFPLAEIAELYKRTEVFFCNEEEARRILGIEDDMEATELLPKIAALGPKIVVITDGSKGAYAYEDMETWFMPPYPDPKPPYERTGAGDAFASTFIAALALDLSLPQALSWGPINSMSVVQQVGAQKGLLKRADLEKFLKEAPEGYRPKLLS
jgi:ribokinase